MTIRGYQETAYAFAVYPSELKILYPMLGLAGEVGELASLLRTKGTVAAVTNEVGDICWYVAALATDLDMEFDGTFKDYVTQINEDLTAMVDLTAAVGLLANDIKKIYRDEELNPDTIRDRLAVVIMSLANFAEGFGLNLDDVAAENLSKLGGRFTRGSLHGSGEDR